jgi:conjugal transfer mating pair stabilization protein TraG
MEYHIYTFGNGEILKGLFDALATCLNAEDGSLYVPLIRISLMIGALWAALYALYGDFMRAIMHWLLPTTIIMQLLFVPQATVVIHDPVSHYLQNVDRVPYGLAMIAGNISKIGYHLTEEVEKLFRLPDDLKYQKTGMLFGSSLIQQARTFKITNEAFAENMRQFVGQCVTYDVMIGRKYTTQALKNSADLWALVSAQPSPIRSFVWRDLEPNPAAAARPRIITCKEGVGFFNAAWSEEVNHTALLFGKKIFGKKANINIQKELLNHLKEAYSTLGEMASEAEALLKQNMMIYAVVDGLEQKSTSLGNAPNFALRRAYLQQRATYETLGALAAETLPSMKAVLEAISYAAFLFVIPMAILPFGFRFLSAWLQTLLWLQMWAPLYAILNYIMTLAAKSKSIAALSLSNEAGVTIASSVGLSNVNADIAAMAGYLGLSIPFLCIAMVKGVGALAQTASTLSQVSQSAGTQAAQDLVSGNYSFGNVGVAARQFSNSSMLNRSYGASYRSGSFHKADGRTDIITSSDGQQILNIATSNVPIHLNVADSVSRQKLEQSGKSYQRALNESEAYVDSMSDVLKKSVDLSNHLGSNKQLNKTTGTGSNIDHTQGLNRLGQIVKDFSENNNMLEQRGAQILAAAAFSTKKAGVGALSDDPNQKGSKVKAATELLSALGISLEANIGLTGSASKQDIYSKAEKVVKSEDFQEAFRQTEQAFQNKTFGTLSEEGQRLVENTHQAWDKTMGHRREAMKNFREADDYQKLASHIQNTASTINANYTPAYVEWLAHHPANHSGLDGVAAILANPKEAARYAQQFLDEVGAIPQKPQEIPSDPKASMYKQHQQESGHALFEINEKNALGKMEALKARGEAQGLKPVTDEGMGSDFKAKQEGIQIQIANQQKKVDQKYQEAEKKHEQQSRKSLFFVTLKQEALHAWDVATHGYDLVTGGFKSAVNYITQPKKQDEDK